jgi:hypothetical protein
VWHLRAIPRLINFVDTPPRAVRRPTTQFVAVHGTIKALFGFTVADTPFARRPNGPYPAGKLASYAERCFGGLTLVSEKEAPAKPVKKSGGTAVHHKDRDMGAALRSIYQKTIDESVPDEMISLLGKLD